MANYPDYDDIEDIRYDPWTNTYNPHQYGGGNPTEDQVIPSSSPYEITLNEYPREDTRQE